MELKDILAISGQPGLYKYVAQSLRGVIVESLIDGKRMNASATSRVSALTEISMFTEVRISLLPTYSPTSGTTQVASRQSLTRSRQRRFRRSLLRCSLSMIVTVFTYQT